MKKYKLLKDLPKLKAGSIFTQDDHVEWYNNDESKISFDETKVENNPEWFEEVKEKEWEVLSFKSSISEFEYNLTSTGVYLHSECLTFATLDILINGGLEKYFIHSVKRLSDGVVFSVGDDLWHSPFMGFGSNYIYKASIKSFHIREEGIMMADLTTNSVDVGAISLNQLKHYVSKEDFSCISDIDIFKIEIDKLKDENKGLRKEVLNYKERVADGGFTFDQMDICNKEGFDSAKSKIIDYINSLDQE